MLPLTRTLFAGLIALTAVDAAAKLYKCEGPEGAISYSDRPCVADQKSREVSGIARTSARTGPGEPTCREVQEFATDVAKAMRRGVDSSAVSDSNGGVGAIDAVSYDIINYVYSFKYTKMYSPSRIGGLAFNKCMGGGFPFPEGRAGGGSGSGTGFVVSGQGHVLTNHHVVDSCKSVTIAADNQSYPAEVLAHDEAWDLALIKTKLPGREPASFRARGKAVLGEPVIVAGYPLRGLLADDLQVTTGSVSALAGIRGDSRTLQITAPVQPGNSGGPLFDASGAVIGVVVAKLNAVALAERTGDIPQNINFAINGDLATRFLSKHQVAFRTSNGKGSRSTTEIAAGARRSVVSVICE